MQFLVWSCLLVVGVYSNPVSQPVYANPPQYVQAQQQPQFQYRPVQQSQYLASQHTNPAVFEQGDGAAQQPQYYTRPQLAQPILGNVDRQVQKVAHHVAGPEYAQQIHSIQLQAQQDQAQAQIQRNALRVATAPRAQPLQYQRAYQTAQPTQRLIQQENPDEGELQENYNHNPSYQFGFDVKDDLYTNYQNRKEQREGDKITGSYSVVDSDGFIRTVKYTADPKQGFKAEVTRQPTDIVVKIPQPYQVNAQPHRQQYQVETQPQRQQYQVEAQPERQQYQIEAQPQRQQPQYIQVPVTIGKLSSQKGESQGQKTQQRVIYQYQ